jgi:hypothetical protein
VSNAHKGSKLILKDALIPVDFSSTHFDFNNDAIGIQYGNLIEPSAGAIYTSRPFEGRFGGGVAVEMSGNNLANVGDNYWSINKNNYQGTVTVLDNPFTTSAQFDFESKAVPTGSGWQVAQYNHGVTTWTTGNTNQYTWSIYCRKLTEDNVTIILQDTNGLNPQGSSKVVSGNIGEWKRITNTWTPTITSGGTYFYITANETAKFELADPQIEKLPFATSFANKTRNNGLLKYPKEVINTLEGCVSFWIYGVGDTGNNPNPVYSSGIDGGFDFLITPTLDPFVRAYATDGGSTQLRPAINLYDKWTHVVVSWNKSTFFGVYINGVLSTSTASPVDWGTYYNTSGTGFYLGSGIRANPNILLSDFKIDKKMPTAEEVSTWYISGKPFYNPYDYRSYAY